MAAVLGQPRVKALLSDEHFSVDGTLIEAWASLKSFRPEDPGDAAPPAASGGREQEAGSAAARQGRNQERDFHGEQRSNATHASTTDPKARLFLKGRGKAVKLCHMGHLLMENRLLAQSGVGAPLPNRASNGLIVDAVLTPATGTAERKAALTMLGRQRGRHRATLGADKAYDTAGFVADLRAMKVTPHVAQNTSGRRSAIDRRTTCHPGYATSQHVRKRIEEAFGWIKTIGTLRKTRHRGTAWVGWLFTLTATACNLIRLPQLLAAA